MCRRAPSRCAGLPARRTTYGTSVVSDDESSVDSAEPGFVYFRRASTVSTELRGAEPFVEGSEGSDHVIVERVRDNVFVNVNGIVERFDASAVQFLSISG